MPPRGRTHASKKIRARDIKTRACEAKISSIFFDWNAISAALVQFWRGRFARWAAHSERRTAMDASTVDAVCNLMLVVIGLIGLLVMVRKE